MIILESSAIISLLIQNDVLHERAVREFEQLEERPVIPASILMETAWALHRSTGDSGFVARKISEVFTLGSVLCATEDMLRHAVAYYQLHHSKLSLVDCELVQWSKAGAQVVTFDEELKKHLERT